MSRYKATVNITVDKLFYKFLELNFSIMIYYNLYHQIFYLSQDLDLTDLNIL